MLLDKWIPGKFLVRQTVCALEACYTDNGTDYSYTQVRMRNNKLELLETGSLSDPRQLPPAIKKNKVPVVLVINGKGVIIKKVELSSGAYESPSELIRKYLPAIHGSGFYIQVYRQDNATAFITLCRTETAEQEMRQLKAGYELAGILIGAPCLMALKPVWSGFSTIRTGTHTAVISNLFLDELHSTPGVEAPPLLIDGLSVPARHVPGFAASLNYLLRLQVSETDTPELSTLEKLHNEKNKFRVLMVSAVALIFILAIANAVLYTVYFDQSSRLEAELFTYQGKYEKINDLLGDYQKNRQLIESASILNKNRFGEYGDRIAKTIPDDITLSELYFSPEKEDSDHEDSLITFHNDRLVLRGSCSKSLVVNEWLNVLKMQRFIKEASLEKFVYNNGGLLPNFEITITTH